MANDSESGGGHRGTEPGGSGPPGHERRCLFVANVTRTDTSLTCTISPVPTSERRLATEWIAAREGSFVSLDETR